MKKIKTSIMTFFLTGISASYVFANGIDEGKITSGLKENFKEINKLFPVLYLIYGFLAFWAMGKVGLQILNTSQQSEQAHEAALEKMANLIKLVLLIPIGFIVVVQLINWIYGTSFEIIKTK